MSGAEERGEFGSTGGRLDARVSNATEIAEERALIHELIQHAN